jgi:hypothetical protein
VQSKGASGPLSIEPLPKDPDRKSPSASLAATLKPLDFWGLIAVDPDRLVKNTRILRWANSLSADPQGE